MKNIQLFDFNLQYPLHIDRETLLNRDAYREFLIRKGYAYDPDASITPVANTAPVIDADIKENPLGNQNRTVADMFDEIEAQAKADFVKRGRKSKKENA